MEIKPHTGYVTRDGHMAWLSDWGLNILERECWRGIVREVGWNTWDAEGRDLSGYAGLDLVAERNEEQDD